MKTEADLGHWLAKLGAGRAACVFSPDVSDTLCVLRQAATSVRQPLRVYTGWSVAYLRNLVSAGQIPVYDKPRVRRFRRDMLDQFLTDPDVAMRRFRVERNRHGS